MELIVAIRGRLAAGGHDAGADKIIWHLGTIASCGSRCHRREQATTLPHVNVATERTSR